MLKTKSTQRWSNLNKSLDFTPKSIIFAEIDFLLYVLIVLVSVTWNQAALQNRFKNFSDVQMIRLNIPWIA